MLRRSYHISCVAFSIKKQGIKLMKMVNPKVKKQFYPGIFDDKTNSMPSIKSLTKVKHEPGRRGERRLAMLNKMFMKNITDLLSTGTFAMNVVGHGIEISKIWVVCSARKLGLTDVNFGYVHIVHRKDANLDLCMIHLPVAYPLVDVKLIDGEVKVTSDFQTVNVFWVCKGDSTDEQTEELLNRVAGPLRAELSSLRVMGVVPYICFVKDRQEAQLVELDRRLAAADYGEDYEPTDLGHLLRTEFTLNTKLSPEMKAKIKQIEDHLPVEEEIIPEMTHNVYGLDHGKIMSRLLASRKKSVDAWRNINEENTVISYRTPENKAADEETGDQKRDLADFLLKRQIQQNKLHKGLRNSCDNLVLEERNLNEEEYWTDDDQYEDEDHDEYYAEPRRPEQDSRQQ